LAAFLFVEVKERITGKKARERKERKLAGVGAPACQEILAGKGMEANRVPSMVG
jgi:hypothetical protein